MKEKSVMDRFELHRLELKIPPPLQALVCVITMWLLGHYFPIAKNFIPFNKVIAAVVALAGVVFIIPAVSSFLKVGTTVHPMHPQKSSALVVEGIYKITRNPMYVGLWLILVAVAVLLDALSPFIVVPCFVWYIERFQVVPEEKILGQVFGESYREYTGRVKRWL